MKILLTALSLCLVLVSCDYEEVAPQEWYDYEIEITGDCPYITVENHDYYGLQYGADYVETGSRVHHDYNKVIMRTIQKKTNDNTTVTATLTIDGIEVFTETTTDPYGLIEIEYQI